VGEQPELARNDRHQDTLARQGGGPCVQRLPGARHVHEHDVGLDRGQVDVPGQDRGDLLGQPAGVLMVLGQPPRPLGQADQPGRRHDPGLPPPGAEEDLQPQRLLDERGIPGQDRADRRAEPLGQAEHHRLGLGRVLRHRRPGHRARVEDARAIQVQRHAPARADRRDLCQRANRHHRPAADLVGIFHGHQAHDRGVVGHRFHRGRHLCGGHQAVRMPRDRAERDRGQHRRRDQLVRADVRGLLAHHDVPGAGQHMHRDLVAQRAGGQVERGLLAGQRGGLLLQPDDRRIVAEQVVAHLGVGHGAPHRRRGPGHRVRAKIHIPAVSHAAPSAPSVTKPGPAR
jgi:hypothetical protein